MAIQYLHSIDFLYVPTSRFQVQYVIQKLIIYDNIKKVIVGK